MIESSEPNKGLTAKDQLALSHAMVAIQACIPLLQYLPQLDAMLADENNPAWTNHGLEISPTMAAFASKSRKEQIAAVVNVTRVLKRMTIEGQAAMDQMEKDLLAIVDEQLGLNQGHD